MKRRKNTRKIREDFRRWSAEAAAAAEKAHHMLEAELDALQADVQQLTTENRRLRMELATTISQLRARDALLQRRIRERRAK